MRPNGGGVRRGFAQIGGKQLYYNNIKTRPDDPQEMFYYPLTTLPQSASIAFLYFLPSPTHPPSPSPTHLHPPQDIPTALTFTALEVTPLSPYSKPLEKSHLCLKTETPSQHEGFLEKPAHRDPSAALKKQGHKGGQGLLGGEIKLDFRIQWNNQNRNIVPNLVNQLMSFLFKKNKSGKLMEQLFYLYPHGEGWTLGKFYQYMRKIRDSVCHYVNEGIIRHFFQIHEPKCEIYSEAEQEYYMKLCRIAVLTFLRNDAIIVSLTSARMAKSKRLSHLIARDAVLRKFLQMARA